MRDLPSPRDPGNGSADIAALAATKVPPAQIVAELERVVSSQHFQASERRRAFLRFIVEETLAGRDGSLKGYTIALAVFGRAESFDPQADPVVRLEARRLRRDLDSYYVDAGQNNPVRIAIPKGSYVPYFERHASTLPAPASAPPFDSGYVPQPNIAKVLDGREPTVFRRALIAAAFAATLSIALAATWVWMAPRAPPLGSSRGPAVLIMPFEALSPGDNARYFALGIGQELTGNLFQFEGFRLFTSSASADQPAGLAASQFGRSLDVAYIVSGSVQTSAEEVRVMTTVSNARSGEVVWTRTYTRSADPKSLMEIQSQLASEIATVIGQPSGVIRSDIGNKPSPRDMASYTCVLQAHGYQRTFSRALFDPVMQCLEDTVQRDPEYSDAWAMLGWLHAHAGRNAYTGLDNAQKEYAKALEAASRAVELQPNNPLALKALAAIYHYLGRYDESDRIGRQAIRLNPNDPDALGQFGWRLAIRGNFSEGVPMLKRAIERSVSPPAWYFHFISVDLYLKGEYEQMLRVAEQAAVSDTGFSQLLIAIANAELGHRGATEAALKKMLQHEPLARDPAGFLRRNGAADQVVDALMAGLRKARSLTSG
jgi:TolB-like protein/Tfp pilus assembly protein PilF